MKFADYFARDAETPNAMRGARIVLIGAGSVGSNLAWQLAHLGADVMTIDPDPLRPENLFRMSVNKIYLGLPKGIAVAKTIRRQVSSDQRIEGLDENWLTCPRLRRLQILASAAVVVDATGRRAVGRLINQDCRDLSKPLLVPSMWGPQETVIGDLLVVRWDDSPRTSGCLQCLRPGRTDAGGLDGLDSQPGQLVDVTTVASFAASVIAAMYRSDSVSGRWLANHIMRGRGYFILRRWPPGVAAVRMLPRRNCPTCSRNSFRPPSGPTSQSGPILSWRHAGAAAAAFLLAWVLIAVAGWFGFAIDLAGAAAAVRWRVEIGAFVSGIGN